MSENAKIFREMQAADDIRDSMKQGILAHARDYLNNGIVGKTYDAITETARESGLMGALYDIYRRCFENAWFGKDVFDGRLHWDNEAGRGEGSDNATIHGKDNPTRQNLGESYDQRAEFYGWDKGQGHERERERGDDLER